MCPNNLHKQRGFSLPIAVFILVIMALLAAGIAQLSSRSNLSATQEELSNRAFYAAESGASWAMSRLFFRPGPAGTAPADRAFSDASCASLGGPPVISGAAGLAGCSVVVSCAAQTVGTTSFYTITSTGTCGTGQVQGIRRIEVGAKNDTL